MSLKIPKILLDEVIETERLLLVPVSEEYAQNMLEELTDEITKYMFFYSPKGIEEEYEFIKSSREKMEQGTDFVVTILDKITKEFLGGAGIHRINTSTPELGIWTKKSAHGRKIGREAVAGLKQWTDRNLDYEYLIYPADKNNAPSRKIAESLGGKVVEEGVKKSPFGKELDEVVYHIPSVAIPTQYLLVGLPYSGKTTLAKELEKKLGFARINIDQLKFEEGYTIVGDDDVPDKVWDKIFEKADDLIVHYLKSGKNLANEYAWITREWRDRARRVASAAGFQTKVIYLKIPTEEVKRRWLENSKTKERFHWPEHEFESYLKDFEEPTEEENIIFYDQMIPVKEWIDKNSI